MAKQTGVLGSLSGMIGNVVCCTWKGVPYVRTRPTIPKSRKPTHRQAMQRAKFKLVNRFLRNYYGLINFCFQGEPGKLERNIAMGHLLKNAITGDYPTYALDYSKVLVTKGELESAGEATVISNSEGVLSFTWKNNSASGNANSTDKTIFLVYHEETDELLFSIDQSNRSQENGTFNLKPLTGKVVHVWIAFRGWLKPVVADSVYLGRVRVGGPI